MPQGSPTPTRRALLAGTAAAFPVLLAGCGSEDRTPPRPGPEVAVLTAAIGAEQALIALYEAARGAHAALISRIDPALAHHREHLSVLRRHYIPGTGAGAVTLTGAPQSPPAVPDRASRALAALRRAESRAAASRAADVTRVGPALAQLFASIGACEAGHAAALIRP